MSSKKEDFANEIKAIVQQHGENIFRDDAKLWELIKQDWTEEDAPPMLKCIRLAIHLGVPQKLLELKSADKRKRTALMKAIADEFSVRLDSDDSLDILDKSPETAYQTVNLFAGALGFKLLNTKNWSRSIVEVAKVAGPTVVTGAVILGKTLLNNKDKDVSLSDILNKINRSLR